MKSFIVCVLLLAAGVAGVGYYRGWFTVDQLKVQEDEHKAKELWNKETK